MMPGSSPPLKLQLSMIIIKSPGGCGFDADRMIESKHSCGVRWRGVAIIR